MEWQKPVAHQFSDEMRYYLHCPTHEVKVKVLVIDLLHDRVRRIRHRCPRCKWRPTAAVVQGVLADVWKYPNAQRLLTAALQEEPLDPEDIENPVTDLTEIAEAEVVEDQPLTDSMEESTMAEKNFQIPADETTNAPQHHKGNGTVLTIDVSRLETMFKKFVEEQEAAKGLWTRILDGAISIGGAVMFVAGAGTVWLGGKVIGAAFGEAEGTEEQK